MNERRWLSARAGACGVFVLVAMAAFAGGCIIADSPPALPASTPGPPHIDHPNVFPPEQLTLKSFPDAFIVPIILADPRATFEYRAFVDYDLLGGASFDRTGVVAPDPTSPNPNETTLSISLLAPPDPSRCHIIEIVVASQFLGAVGEPSGHTPDQHGGDVAHWAYAPNGALQSCPVYDGGPPPDMDSGDGSSVQ